MREAAYFGAEFKRVLAGDLGETGGEGIAVIAVDDGTAGAAGGEDAVIASDDGNRLYAESNRAIQRCGPTELGQIISQAERRAIVAETQVSNPEIADHGRRERVGVGDHNLVGVKRLRTAVYAGFRIVRIDGQIEIVPVCVADESTLLVREAVIDAAVVLVIVAADAG